MSAQPGRFARSRRDTNRVACLATAWDVARRCACRLATSRHRPCSIRAHEDRNAPARNGALLQLRGLDVAGRSGLHPRPDRQLEPDVRVSAGLQHPVVDDDRHVHRPRSPEGLRHRGRRRRARPARCCGGPEACRLSGTFAWQTADTASSRALNLTLDATAAVSAAAPRRSSRRTAPARIHSPSPARGCEPEPPPEAEQEEGRTMAHQELRYHELDYSLLDTVMGGSAPAPMASAARFLPQVPDPRPRRR